jgi:hypothetical protein
MKQPRDPYARKRRAALKWMRERGITEPRAIYSAPLLRRQLEHVRVDLCAPIK